jgi:hypothetical protein
VMLMRADLALKETQAFWEALHNLVIIIGAIVTASGRRGRDLQRAERPDG